MQEGENRENKDYKGNKGNKSFLVSLVSPTLWRVHIAEGIFCEMKKRLRSLLDANEEAAFEIW